MFQSSATDLNERNISTNANQKRYSNFVLVKHEDQEKVRYHGVLSSSTVAPHIKRVHLYRKPVLLEPYKQGWRRGTTTQTSHTNEPNARTTASKKKRNIQHFLTGGSKAQNHHHTSSSQTSSTISLRRRLPIIIQPTNPRYIQRSA